MDLITDYGKEYIYSILENGIETLELVLIFDGYEVDRKRVSVRWEGCKGYVDYYKTFEETPNCYMICLMHKGNAVYAYSQNMDYPWPTDSITVDFSKPAIELI